MKLKSIEIGTGFIYLFFILFESGKKWEHHACRFQKQNNIGSRRISEEKQVWKVYKTCWILTLIAKLSTIS